MDGNSSQSGQSSIGPWGPAGDVIMSLLPLVVLVTVTIYGNGVPAYKSLPVITVFMGVLRLGYFATSPALVLGAIIGGTLDALTPLAIVAGAIFLFEVMDVIGSLAWFAREMGRITHHEPVPQVMLIGWAFAYTVEGASGFGTPVVLASRLLVELGHSPVDSICCTLIMNTLATVFGAVGTPLWFGFSGLGLSEAEFLDLSARQAVLNGLCGLVIPLLALRMLVPWDKIKQDLVFIYASILSCVVPSIAFAFVSTEFPSLAGGLIGLAVTAFLTSRRKPPSVLEADVETGSSDEYQTTEHSRREQVENDLGTLDDDAQGKVNQDCDPVGTDSTADSVNSSQQELLLENKMHKSEDGEQVDKLESKASVTTELCALGSERSPLAVLWFTFPITSSILLLILSRVKEIGLQSVLRQIDPHVSVQLGSLGEFQLSSALVLQLKNIANLDELQWKFELLYVPFLIPFVIVSMLNLALATKVQRLRPPNMYGVDSETRFRTVTYHAFRVVVRKLKRPTIALVGALTLVGLFRKGGDESPAFVVGSTLAGVLQLGWVVIAVPLGAVGSFFSGSTTVSNLTFGRVHQIAAESIMVRETTLLALQSIGGTMGNMVCLANIVNVKAVLDVHEPEGVFIRRNLPVLFVYYLLATGLGSLLFFVIWI